jgi:hypothetical protein
MIALLLASSVVLGLAPRDSRLSASVALLSESPAVKSFLDRPGRGFVEAWARFPAALGDDVIFGVDQEFLDGMRRPLFVPGGDWMGLAGIQRSGVVFVAVGTEDTHAGKPSKDRKWELRMLGKPLSPDTWYRLRAEADFAKREWISFSVNGPSVNANFDLKGMKLDYPNMLPFNDRAVTYYVYAMRGRSMMKGGEARVYFDDVRGGTVDGTGRETLLFTDGFEKQKELMKQPVELPQIKVEKYRQSFWYFERDESIFTIEQADFARTGRAVGVADARID